jgi:hypothetical protein
MKKITLIIALLGIQALSTAQETETTTPVQTKRTLYASFGIASTDDYKINKNLKMTDMPQLSSTAPEVTLGYNVTGEKVLIDLELNANYMDKKTSTDRVKYVSSGVKLRGHYIPVKTTDFFLSGGFDLSYAVNHFDLYSRGNSIDLNDLEPSTHTGHISLYNNQLYLGPSIAFGAFQTYVYPLRLNVGYEWAVYSSRWDSEFARVDNTFRESGQGRFYAKLSIDL